MAFSDYSTNVSINNKSNFNGEVGMSDKEFSNLPSIHLNDPSRRDFFTKTSILAGGFLAFGWPFLTRRSGSAFAAQPRQVVQSGGAVRYRLELDRAIVGPLQTTEGGVVSGEIITYQDGNSPILKKRLGRLKYEDIVFTCGANFAAPFFQWLGETLSQQGRRKNGAIVAVNQIGQIIDRREFQNALVKEVVFPGLDVASNEPGYFKVTVTPERIRYQSSSSGQTVPPSPTNQGVLSSSKFRLLIEGLEQACTFVRRIEPLVVKQEIIHYVDGGSAGESRISAGRPDVGNLVITLPQHQAGPFTTWFSSFVLQGQMAGNVRQGVLEFLAPNGRTVLAGVGLGNLGIFRMIPVTVGGPPQVQVEMYCETIQLMQYPGGGGGGSRQRAPRSRRKSLRKPETGKPLQRIPQKK